MTDQVGSVPKALLQPNESPGGGMRAHEKSAIAGFFS
jgi:hypothetical protein